MGIFSWKTSDTNRSISISEIDSEHTTSISFMCAPDGRIWEETEYEGYGEFDGKDVYELIAELNGKTTREEGLDLVFKNNPGGEFEGAARNGIVVPKFFQLKENCKNFDNFPHSRSCEHQGCFYSEEESDDNN